jgi:hypothetical protein
MTPGTKKMFNDAAFAKMKKVWRGGGPLPFHLAPLSPSPHISLPSHPGTPPRQAPTNPTPKPPPPHPPTPTPRAPAS